MEHGGNNILVTSRRRFFAGALLLASSALQAQVAILESVAGSVKEGTWRLRFRTGPASRMKVAKATLLLHLASGEPPALIEILKPVKHQAAAELQPKGWVTVRFDVRSAQRLIDRDEWLEFRVSGSSVFHLPSQTGFAPYLVLEGSR